MQIKYDWPDMPLGTPMSFGGLLVPNGQVLEVTVEQSKAFYNVTGQTFEQAAKTNDNLTIIRKKVS